MPVAERYRQQVALLVEALPLVAREACFALKGGTAINLFYRDLPRLSVDIDLTYLPIENRATSLAGIDAALHRLSGAIQRGLPGTRVVPARLRESDTIYKLTINRRHAQIKIDVTPVMRGCVFAPGLRAVTAPVERDYGYAETTVVSFADLFAGKIVAALDRQHPRDLFDVRLLLANEGINDDLRRAFLVYIAGHDRPMAEVLAPTRKNLSADFIAEFNGMTIEPITADDLTDVRERLIAEVVGEMPTRHKEFLISFEEGRPDWSAIELPHAAQLPAIRWREENLGKLRKSKRAELVAQLHRALGQQA